jgi:predicted homoserine dehydrogenase-like protein
MIIVDTALEERRRAGNPVRVALTGAGFMGRGVTLQISTAVPGMRVAAIANRTVENAVRAYREAGIENVRIAKSPQELNDAIASGEPVVTADHMSVCDAPGIEAVLEVTGEVDLGAKIALRAIEAGKHVVLMNAELDGTVGPLLKVHADRAGVVVSNVDGDQPGNIMNLYRFVKCIGLRPVLCGNIKGLQDHRRTPETQRGFAEKHHQKPRMVTSFADGTKISFEMAVTANATGMRVGRRGMYGPSCKHVNEALHLFPMDEMMSTGLVDYILGAEPGPGVFVLAYGDHPIQQRYLTYFKMGDGPLYCFYTPYHLCHMETPLTLARAVLFRDAAVTPAGPPVTDVITMAKRDLKAGEVLDGIGGFTVYGMLENYETARGENLLPMGVAEGCRVRRDLPSDHPITYDDVELPAGRLIDRLRAEQHAHFTAATAVS